MPFGYRFITTPEQLVVIRIIHGLATAIYGPVTLAYVSELSQSAKAERLGWFGIARSGGYVVCGSACCRVAFVNTYAGRRLYHDWIHQ